MVTISNVFCRLVVHFSLLSQRWDGTLPSSSWLLRCVWASTSPSATLATSGLPPTFSSLTLRSRLKSGLASFNDVCMFVCLRQTIIMLVARFVAYMEDDFDLALVSRVCERYTQVFLLLSTPSKMLNDMCGQKNTFVLCHITCVRYCYCLNFSTFSA